MLVICIVIILVIIMSLSSSSEGRPPVIVCNSTSCNWNKLCRCTRKQVAIYDNTVEGLCLYHTESMKDRVLEPMRKKRMIEYNSDEEFGVEMMDKITKLQEEKLLKDPDTFARWMDKVFRKRQAGRKE